MMQSRQLDWLSKLKALFSLDEKKEKERVNIENQIKIMEECLAEIKHLNT